LDVFVAPIITGVAVGFALRGAAIFGEVGANSLRADEERIDFARWVRDRDRQFTAELRKVVNSAGLQLYAGSTVNQFHNLMIGVLHEYRDRASSAARSYRSLAQSEGWLHRLIRATTRREPKPLELSPYGHLVLLGWRYMGSPVPGTEDPTVWPNEDPSRADHAEEIRPLEKLEGLTWQAARRRRTSSRF
jgi:hypothetical protein